jgi:hypothetical protein
MLDAVMVIELGTQKSRLTASRKGHRNWAAQAKMDGRTTSTTKTIMFHVLWYWLFAEASVDNCSSLRTAWHKKILALGTNCAPFCSVVSLMNKHISDFYL